MSVRRLQNITASAKDAAQLASTVQREFDNVYRNISESELLALSPLSRAGNDLSISASSRTTDGYLSKEDFIRFSDTAVAFIAGGGITAVERANWNAAYAHSLLPMSVTLDAVLDPVANKNFNMGAKNLRFRFLAPGPTGTYDGAFEIDGVGNWTGDLLHIHQHTGTVPAGADLMHLETTDVDCTPLHIITGGTKSILLDKAIAWGTTASEPKLDRSAATLELRLADNSQWADMSLGVLAAVTYVRTGASGQAASGMIRMQNNTNIEWRNAGGSADFGLGLDASNILTTDADFKTTRTSSATQGFRSVMGTIANSTPVMDASFTMNAAGTTFRIIEVVANVGGSGYSALSSLIRLRRGATDVFSVSVDGATVIGTVGTDCTINNSNVYVQGGTVYFANAAYHGVSDAQVHITFRGASGVAKWQIQKDAGGDFWISCNTLSRNVMKFSAASGNPTTLFAHLTVEGPSGYNAAGETATLNIGTSTINLTATYNTSLQLNVPTSHTIIMRINSVAQWTLNSSGNVDMVGRVTTYENLATQGRGVPPIRYVREETQQDIDIAWQNMTNTNAAGVYRISVFYRTFFVDAGTSTVHVDVRWSNASQSYTGATLTLAAVSGYQQYTLVVYHDNAGASYIQAQADYTGVGGSADQYDMWVVAERLY